MKFSEYRIWAKYELYEGLRRTFVQQVFQHINFQYLLVDYFVSDSFVIFIKIGWYKNSKLKWYVKLKFFKLIFTSSNCFARRCGCVCWPCWNRGCLASKVFRVQHLWWAVSGSHLLLQQGQRLLRPTLCRTAEYPSMLCLWWGKFKRHCCIDTFPTIRSWKRAERRIM